MSKYGKELAQVGYAYHELERVLVRLYIEKALLEKETIVYNTVSENLYRNYRCYLEDCYEHPEYLKIVLKDISVNDASDIISSIKNDLLEFYHHKRIARFIDELSNID
jgi:hypothetical protein